MVTVCPSPHRQQSFSEGLTGWYSERVDAGTPSGSGRNSPAFHSPRRDNGLGSGGQLPDSPPQLGDASAPSHTQTTPTRVMILSQETAPSSGSDSSGTEESLPGQDFLRLVVTNAVQGFRRDESLPSSGLERGGRAGEAGSGPPGDERTKESPKDISDFGWTKISLPSQPSRPRGPGPG